MSAALACPWCGGILAGELPDVCPHCGAALTERAEGVAEPGVVGTVVVPVNPDLAELAPSLAQQLTTSPVSESTSRAAPAQQVLDQVIGADPRLAEAVGSSPFRPEEADEGVAFPTDQVRREIERMRLDAERAALEVQAVEYEYTIEDRAAAADVPGAEPASDEAAADDAGPGAGSDGSAADPRERGVDEERPPYSRPAG